MDFESKTFYLTNIKGFTKKQLLEHYQLYEGYIKSLNKIDKKLKDLKNYENPSTTYSNIRCLKLGQSYANDGVILHELYFSNLGGEKKEPYGKVLNLINSNFGNYDTFKKIFKSIGMSMRGWVVLATNLNKDILNIIGQDTHDKGIIYYHFPILVMDVYEHAYMIDFGIDKSRYIDVFFENINWEEVNCRLDMMN